MMKKIVLSLFCLIILIPATGHSRGDEGNVISIELTVPDAGWEIKINEIYKVTNH